MAGKGGKGLLAAKTTAANKDKKKPVYRSSRAGLQMSTSMARSSTPKKTKAHWDDTSVRVFCEVCAAEVLAGNRPTAHFNQIGWQNVERRFKDIAGKEYDERQLKNKWAALKSDWILWKNLIGKETVIGWNRGTKTIEASETWWKEKTAQNANVQKFRDAGFKNALHMEIMFGDISATGASDSTPQMGLHALYEQERVEREVNEARTPVSDEAEIIRQMPTTRTPNASRKRKSFEGKSSKSRGPQMTGAAAQIHEDMVGLQRIVESYGESSRSTPTVTGGEPMANPHVQRCIEILRSTPGIEHNSTLYYYVINLFGKTVWRDVWLSLNPDERKGWVEARMKNKSST